MDKLIFDLNMNLDGEKFYDEELKRTATVKELNNVKAYIERIDKDDYAINIDEKLTGLK